MSQADINSKQFSYREKIQMLKYRNTKRLGYNLKMAPVWKYHRVIMGIFDFRKIFVEQVSLLFKNVEINFASQRIFWNLLRLYQKCRKKCRIFLSRKKYRRKVHFSTKFKQIYVWNDYGILKWENRGGSQIYSESLMNYLKWGKVEFKNKLELELLADNWCRK